MKDGNVLEREKRTASRFIAVLVFTALTGFITFVWPIEGGVWQQWAFLLHTAQGLCLAVLFVYYVYLHFRRTLALRRPGVALAGLLSATGGLALVASGLHITLFGQSEAARWIYWLHVVAGGGALLLIAGHVLGHWLSWPQQRATQRPPLFTLEALTRRWSVWLAASTVGVIALGSGAYALLPSPYVDQAAIQPYDLSKYGSNPFAPSKNLTANGGFYDARTRGRLARVRLVPPGHIQRVAVLDPREGRRRSRVSDQRQLARHQERHRGDALLRRLPRTRRDDERPALEGRQARHVRPPA